jgi:hypothetical protein
MWVRKSATAGGVDEEAFSCTVRPGD